MKITAIVAACALLLLVTTTHAASFSCDVKRAGMNVPGSNNRFQVVCNNPQSDSGNTNIIYFVYPISLGETTANAMATIASNAVAANKRLFIAYASGTSSYCNVPAMCRKITTLAIEA